MLRRLMLYGLLAWASLGIGCRSCQNTDDYTGPLPDQPSDFMYRKNSILGGDPEQPNEAMTPESGQAAVSGDASPSESNDEGQPAETSPTDSQPELSPMPDPNLSTRAPTRAIEPRTR